MYNKTFKYQKLNSDFDNIYYYEELLGIFKTEFRKIICNNIDKFFDDPNVSIDLRSKKHLFKRLNFSLEVPVNELDYTSPKLLENIISDDFYINYNGIDFELYVVKETIYDDKLKNKFTRKFMSVTIATYFLIDIRRQFIKNNINDKKMNDFIKNKLKQIYNKNKNII